jgi:hypothetical protein
MYTKGEVPITMLQLQHFSIYFLSEISKLKRLFAYSVISLSAAVRYNFGRLGAPEDKDKFLTAFLNAPYI